MHLRVQVTRPTSRIKELYDEFERLQTVMKALKEENETISELKSDYQDLI